MRNVFEAIDEPSFQERKKSSNNITVLIAVIFTVVISAITSHVFFGILAGTVLIIIQTVKSKSHNQFFLKKLEFDYESIIIEYYQNETLKTKSGSINDFEILKEFTIEKVSVAYLKINYQNKILLKQHLIYPWNERKFDEIISTFIAVKNK